MELGESVEECIRREVKEEINIEIKSLQLFGVFSGKELFAKLRNRFDKQPCEANYANAVGTVVILSLSGSRIH
ncbi:NUDIX domain-containing protein [Tissierella sp. MSJ-40]|uniref:NUDIX domain-containing protein n=1 Tax=Tissierella simiarum TaxID=2841534 RepID=A0ABS6E9D2_9FIRM|nr:NUDIX domain-containing protein [Tissierella simiarum]MBU5439146.1 NUDIX domain-containing protein [Tissierella simiarum]